MALIGYARVSTSDQELSLQTTALKQAGCDRIYSEHASGAKTDRPELAAALSYMREGDMLVVWKLDRLGRSVQHLVATLTDLGDRGIEFRSLTEGIDTATAGGRLIFHVFAALAEFERELIRERTNAGLVAARARGRRGGRRKVLTGAKLEQARLMKKSGRYTVSDIAGVVGVSQATLYRYLPEDNEKEAASG